MKFRKKPVVIEAMQWDGENFRELYHRVHEGLQKEANSRIWMQTETAIAVRTLDSVAYMFKGDWLVIGVLGELYPVKPDIFAMTYEAVNDNGGKV